MLYDNQISLKSTFIETARDYRHFGFIKNSPTLSEKLVKFNNVF